MLLGLVVMDVRFLYGFKSRLMILYDSEGGVQTLCRVLGFSVHSKTLEIPCLDRLVQDSKPTS